MNKCQHCHKEIAGERLPAACPHCDMGTACSGENCVYCKTLEKWVNACKKPEDGGTATNGADVAPEQINAYTREAYCPECDERTMQLLHGYEADGTLWNGKECNCGSFQCMICDFLVEHSKACTR